MRVAWLTMSTSVVHPLEGSLTAWGFTVDPTSNPASLMASIDTAGEPLIIVIDGDFPDSLGICRTLRPYKARHPLFLLHLSTLPQLADVEPALAAGVDSFLQKPWAEPTLLTTLNTIRRLLEYQYSLENLTTELIHANRELHQLATKDASTGVANRRCFDEYLSEEWNRASRREYPLSLLLITIDQLSEYQESYGHTARDQRLSAIAAFIDTTVSRAGDLVARYAKNQFAILLPNTDSLGSLVVAESIRVGVRGLAIPHPANRQSFLTVSVGTGTVQPTAANQPRHLTGLAEQASQQAAAIGNTVRQS